MFRTFLLTLAAYRNRRSLAALVDDTRRGASRGGVGRALLGLASALAGRSSNRPSDFRAYLDFIAKDQASPPELSTMLDEVEHEGDTRPRDEK